MGKYNIFVRNSKRGAYLEKNYGKSKYIYKFYML